MYTDLLNSVIEYVKEASALCDISNASVESKGGASNFVTSADIAVENYLRERLPQLICGSGMIGEETPSSDYGKEYLWIVDPIDGTANFIRQFNLSAISVGLIHQGNPILGVVYNPFTHDLYCAEEGHGAYLNGKPIHVSDRDFTHSTICTAFSLYDKTKATPCFRILERVYMECDDQRRLGSAALEIASLAAGQSDLYFEIRIFPWDYAGAIAILKEAGGYFAVPGHETMPFEGPASVVCANTKANFKHLMQIVEEELKA